MISEYGKVFEHCAAVGDGDYRRKMIEKAEAHYAFILFEKNERLSWSGLKRFFVRAHHQLASFDTIEVKNAVRKSKTVGGLLKRGVLVAGDPWLYFWTFLVVKTGRAIKKPYTAVKGYFSGRRMTA